MRKILLMMVIGTLVTVPAMAMAVSPPNASWVANCTKSQYKPKSILLACGDGTNGLVNLKWSHWSTTKATGSGVNAVNDCTPNCVNGKVKKTRVTVTLSKPIRCAHRKHKVFDHALLRFRGQTGPQSRQTFVLGCPTR